MTVCSNFTVDIRIENLPTEMTYFWIYVTFDPDAMSVKNLEPKIGSWHTYWAIDNVNGVIRLGADGRDWSEDATWAKVTFHCNGAGTSTIGFRSDSAIEFEQFIDILIDFENSREATVTQRAPRPAPRYSDAVGGELFTVNKLAVLVRYLAIIGVVVAVTAVYVLKRRREA